MDRGRWGGWVYIMADRYRGAMYVGMTSDLAARIHQHRTGSGSDFCKRYGLYRLVWAEHIEPRDRRGAHRGRPSIVMADRRMMQSVG